MKFTKLATIFVNPISKHEDARRREFILNILLLSLLTLLMLATVSSVISSFSATSEQLAHDNMSLLELMGVLGFFLALYVFSRIGYARIASYLFVCLLFLFTMRIAYTWGPDVPSAILLYALVIAISGILISSRFAFVIAVAFGVLIPAINYLQVAQIIPVDTYWRTESFEIEDAFVTSIILIIIATVSWLSNREIERSLVRARKSEAELKIERDLLEVRVQERTNELRKAEMERISQSYRFIEFGRLASGIFHDLANPLTSISLTIDSISRSAKSDDSEYVTTLHKEVDQAKRATAHMQKLLGTMRRHLARESEHESFSIIRAAEDVLQMLRAYARQHEIELICKAPEDVEYAGDLTAFTQILTNLISNAVESFGDSNRTDSRLVTVSIRKTQGSVFVYVADTGLGISPELMDSIFEPFVSTKSASGGLGIGLSLVKQIVEREFCGSILVESEVGKGTVFTVQLPIREP